MFIRRNLRHRCSPCWVSGFVVIGLAAFAAASEAQQSYEVVIANGRVIDPESGLDAVRHVGIDGGSIQAISSEPLSGRETVDASGLIVAPGFIDLHQHSYTPIDEGLYRTKAMDGVTTVLERR